MTCSIYLVTLLGTETRQWGLEVVATSVLAGSIALAAQESAVNGFPKPLIPPCTVRSILPSVRNCKRNQIQKCWDQSRHWHNSLHGTGSVHSQKVILYMCFTAWAELC